MTNNSNRIQLPGDLLVIQYCLRIDPWFQLLPSTTHATQCFLEVPCGPLQERTCPPPRPAKVHAEVMAFQSPRDLEEVLKTIGTGLVVDVFVDFSNRGPSDPHMSPHMSCRHSSFWCMVWEQHKHIYHAFTSVVSRNSWPMTHIEPNLTTLDMHPNVTHAQTCCTRFNA